MRQDVIESVKIAPPGSVVVAHFSGYTMSDWVSILTLAYLAILIGEKVYRCVQARARTNHSHQRRRKSDK